MQERNILITGPPGIGKTTLIKKLIEKLRYCHPVGFYTQEIRGVSGRKGFELISLDGRKGILAHVDIKSNFRIGKYKVDVSGFESFIEPIDFFKPSNKLIIIDEIGKMESFSNKFNTLLEDILVCEKPVIATIALKGGGIVSEIKKRNDVKLFVMGYNNRDSLLSEILELKLERFC